MKTILPRITILGRPNVGKSSLFNRFVGERRALVHNTAGVTRDYLEASATWWIYGQRWEFCLSDTGGLGPGPFSEQIWNQVQIALNQTQLAVFVFDAQCGLISEDIHWVREIQKITHKKIPLIGFVNKVDHLSHDNQGLEFHQLGLTSLITGSAEHDRGIETLKETIVSQENLFQSSTEEPTFSHYPNIAIIGQPNAGKSTLFNYFFGTTRVITSPIPGTTTDLVSSIMTLGDQKFNLLDTAGIRRKNKTQQGVEVLSLMQVKKVLKKTDVAIFLLEAGRKIFDQDKKIAQLIEESGASLILAMNKWDLTDQTLKTKQSIQRAIQQEMPYLDYAPILFTSGLKGYGWKTLPSLLKTILKQRQYKIQTRELTDWIRHEMQRYSETHPNKFYLCHQTSKNPPSFVCHVSRASQISSNVKRYLIHSLRKRWTYLGSPIRLTFVSDHSPRK